MPTRLDWRVGPTGDEPVQAEPRPTVLPQRRTRWPLTLLLTAFYATALLAAATFGFQLGRWQEARVSNLGGIANQLALEDLAWAQADEDLYFSTLDPSAAATPGRVQQFWALAPMVVRHEIVEVRFLPPDRAEARVRRSAGPLTPADAASPGDVELRFYRLVGQSWLRTDAP